MNVGAFGVLAALEWDGEQGSVQTLDSLAGAGYRYPVLGVAMGVFLFALTGFPPLGGFIGKYLVFAAAVNSGLTWLAVIGVLASVVSAYYYLRILVVMWMRSEDEAPEAARPSLALAPSTAAVLGVCAVLLLVLGVVPGGLIEAAEGYFSGAGAVLSAVR
jgi:NADH-quinone oxidoreductase subunit N